MSRLLEDGSGYPRVLNFLGIVLMHYTGKNDGFFDANAKTDRYGRLLDALKQLKITLEKSIQEDQIINALRKSIQNAKQTEFIKAFIAAFELCFLPKDKKGKEKEEQIEKTIGLEEFTSYLTTLFTGIVAEDFFETIKYCTFNARHNTEEKISSLRNLITAATGSNYQSSLSLFIQGACDFVDTIRKTIPSILDGSSREFYTIALTALNYAINETLMLIIQAGMQSSKKKDEKGKGKEHEENSTYVSAEREITKKIISALSKTINEAFGKYLGSISATIPLVWEYVAENSIETLITLCNTYLKDKNANKKDKAAEILTEIYNYYTAGTIAPGFGIANPGLLLQQKELELCKPDEKTAKKTEAEHVSSSIPDFIRTSAQKTLADNFAGTADAIRGLLYQYQISRQSIYYQLVDMYNNYSNNNIASKRGRVHSAKSLMDSVPTKEPNAKVNNMENGGKEKEVEKIDERKKPFDTPTDFITALRISINHFNTFIGRENSNLPHPITTNIKEKISFLRETNYISMQYMGQFVDNYAAQFECALRSEKDQFYYELHQYTNDDLYRQSQTRVEGFFSRIGHSLKLWNNNKNPRDVILNQIHSNLMNCRTAEHYFLFFVATYTANQNIILNSTYKKAIQKILEGVLDQHILTNKKFRLQYNSEQLKAINKICWSLNIMTMDLYKNFEFQIEEKVKAENHSFLERNPNQEDLIPDSNLRNHGKNLALFKATIRHKMASHYYADHVKSTGEFVLTPEAIALLAQIPATIAENTPIPCAGALAAAINAAGNYADNTLQVAQAEALASMQTGTLSTNDFNEIATKLTEIFQDQISEMFNEEDVKNFASFCVLNMRQAMKNNFKNVSKGTNLINRLIQAVFIENTKLTRIPFRKDHYGVVKEGNIDGSYTFQGMVNRVRICVSENVKNPIDALSEAEPLQNKNEEEEKEKEKEKETDEKKGEASDATNPKEIFYEEISDKEREAGYKKYGAAHLPNVDLARHLGSAGIFKLQGPTKDEPTKLHYAYTTTIVSPSHR